MSAASSLKISVLDQSVSCAGRDEGHALRDTLDLMRRIDPAWPEPSGHRIGLAFKCDSPAEVDALYIKVTEASLTYVAIDDEGRPREIPASSRP